jgi:hypothetical protein
MSISEIFVQGSNFASMVGAMEERFYTQRLRPEVLWEIQRTNERFSEPSFDTEVESDLLKDEEGI